MLFDPSTLRQLHNQNASMFGRVEFKQQKQDKIIIIIYQYYYFPPVNNNLRGMAHRQTNNEGTMKIDMKTTPMSMEVMMKTILAEIKDVTEDDLIVMSSDEIRTFYEELIAANQTNPTSSQHTPSESVAENNKLKSQGQNKKEILVQSTLKLVPLNNIKNTKDSTSLQSTKKPKSPILIDGAEYQRPIYLGQESYQLAFNRYEIIYGPNLTTVQEKRAAITKAYSPTVLSTVKALKPHEVAETYERLRQPEKKQHGFLQLSKPPELQKFRIFIESLARDQKLEQFEKKQESQRLKRKKGSDLRKSSYNESCQGTEGSEYKDQMNFRVDKKKQTSEFKLFPALKQKKSNLKKKKQVKQKSVQTEKFMLDEFYNQDRPYNGNKLTIVSHVQYVEEDDMQQIQSVRMRPQGLMDEQQINVPHKISGMEVKKLLMDPHQRPREEILSWAKCIKNLVRQFQHQYLSQFQQDWQIITN